MKKFLLFIGILFLLIIAAAAIIPIFFKDDIKAAIDNQIASSVNAKVYYNENKISLSLFSRFPSVSASVGDIAVVGNDEFAKDTLAAIGKFEVAINLFSLFGDEIKIKGIYLDNPSFNIIVLENGKANYDIAVPSTEEPAPVEDTSGDGINVGIEKWQITNGSFVYDDRTLPYYMKMTAINHSGSGDFGANVFDMMSNTTAVLNSMKYDGIEYLSNKKIDAEVTMAMDLDQFKFTFKENQLLVNDFAMSFDGYLAMPTDDIVMDITFNTKNNSFSSLLSLVPGMYMEGFEKLKTSGEVAFDGFVRGTYNDTSMPAFNVGLKVANGMFQYPDLPTAIRNVSMDMEIDNKDGNIDNTKVEIRQFHMDMGSNPFDAKLLIKNLVNYDMVAMLNATLNLAELSSMFPIDGMSMKGIFNAKLNASGIYDDAAKTIPTIDLRMALTDGMVKSSEYPIPMEDMQMVASVVNTNGKMANTIISLERFAMLLDGEKLEATAKIQNLEDYTWDVMIDGAIDLAKMTKIFPLEGMELAGKIDAKVNSSGKMSDMEAERYDRLTTSGSMQISDFKFSSADMPQGLTISKAKASIDPKAINLSQYEGTLGASDMSITGQITNYMAFMLDDEGIIKGRVDFRSNKFDLNEWMTEEESTESTEELNLEVIKVPENIDFVLESSIKEVLYDKLTLNNLNGQLIVRDGSVRMEDVTFNLLKGTFTMNGAYVTKNQPEPLFNFDFGIKELSIAESYKALDMVKMLAPVAEHITGNFSTNFKIAGHLGQDMMPIMGSLSGAGLLQVAEAALREMPILNSAANLVNFSGAQSDGSFVMKDLLMAAEVKDGRLHVKPFELMLGDRKATISGSNGIDGSLDYVLSTSVPSGAAGAAVNAALASLTGGAGAIGENINVNLKITGSYNSPKISIASAGPGSGDGGIKAVAKEKLAEEMEKQKAEIENKANEEIAKQRAEAERIAQEEAKKLEERAKDEFKTILKDSATSTTIDNAKNALKGLIKKKGGN